MKLFFSFFSLLFFITNFAMETKGQISYVKEHFVPERPRVISIVAYFNGQKVGHLIPWDKSCNRVGQLWVAEDMRKKGIGKELLTQFADYCKENKWGSVDGHIDPNDPIKGYFEKLSKAYPIIMTPANSSSILIDLKFEENK